MPKVACINCAVEVEVPQEALGTKRTCESCGTLFLLELPPEEANVPEHVTISLGEAFKTPPASGAVASNGGNGSFVKNLFSRLFGGK